MPNELNKVHNADFLTNTLPDKSVQLIIADPPYFEVKGDFDFIWADRDAYLADVEKWAQECKRVLADNGTLFWWGMDRKIAYSQIVLDKYLHLLGTLVWEKPNLQNEWDSRRTFPERGQERFLMYANDYEPDSFVNFNESVVFVFQPIFDWFLSEWQKSGLTRKEVDLACGTKNVSQYWFLKRNFQIPTAEKYKVLQELAKEKAFRREYEDLRREYEDLRREYEDLRRPFNNFLKLTDVLRFSQQRRSKYPHPTQKPEKLTRALILTCSRPNDIVLAPFAGSGTECAMAAKEGRRFVGFDIDAGYAKMANERAAQHLNQMQIFTQ
jgi:DNA modification methylase